MHITFALLVRRASSAPSEADFGRHTKPRKRVFDWSCTWLVIAMTHEREREKGYDSKGRVSRACGRRWCPRPRPSVRPSAIWIQLPPLFAAWDDRWRERADADADGRDVGTEGPIWSDLLRVDTDEQNYSQKRFIRVFGALGVWYCRNHDWFYSPRDKK